MFAKSLGKPLLIATPLGLLTFLTTTYLQEIYTYVFGPQQIENFAQTISYGTLLRACLWLLAGIVLCLSLLILQYREHHRNKDTASSPTKDDDRQARRLQLLRNLSGDEKSILRQYMDQDKKTLYFNINDGVPAGLAERGILSNPTGIAYDMETAYNLSEWAWEMLNKDKWLIYKRAKAKPRPPSPYPPWDVHG